MAWGAIKGNLKTESVIIWYDNARSHAACGAQNAFLPNFPRIVKMSNHGIKHLFNVLYTMYTMKLQAMLFVMGFLFDFMLKVPANSYGHVRTLSSPNHTVFLGKFD